MKLYRDMSPKEKQESDRDWQEMFDLMKQFAEIKMQQFDQLTPQEREYLRESGSFDSFV